LTAHRRRSIVVVSLKEERQMAQITIADRLDLGGRLVHFARDAGRVKARRKGEAAPGAGDDCVWWGVHVRS
jgi:hypothetical protein